MFDSRYLDTLSEAQLLVLYEQCQSTAKTERRRGSFGLAHWWFERSAEVCDALSRYYLAESEPNFSRAQLAFEDMPVRIAPELRRLN